MEYQEQHKRAVELHDYFSAKVRRGSGGEWCEVRVLTSLAALTREVLDRRHVHSSACYPWHEGLLITHKNLLAKAEQLRAITGSRVAAQAEPVTKFFSTFSAAAIVFVVSAHFASLVSAIVQSTIAN